MTRNRNDSNNSMTCTRNDSAILDAQRDGITDSVAIAKKTGLEVDWHHLNVTKP